MVKHCHGRQRQLCRHLDQHQPGRRRIGRLRERFDSSGIGQADFQVNTTFAGDQMHSQVAMDADGDFVIVWESDAQDGSGWESMAGDTTPRARPKGANF